MPSSIRNETHCALEALSIRRYDGPSQWANYEIAISLRLVLHPASPPSVASVSGDSLCAVACSLRSQKHLVRLRDLPGPIAEFHLTWLARQFAITRKYITESPAADAVVQHAMRHSSPETKRFYQLGLAHQVREHLERVNQKTHEERDALQNRDSGSRPEQVQQIEVCN